MSTIMMPLKFLWKKFFETKTLFMIHEIGELPYIQRPQNNDEDHVIYLFLSQESANIFLADLIERVDISPSTVRIVEHEVPYILGVCESIQEYYKTNEKGNIRFDLIEMVEDRIIAQDTLWSSTTIYN